MSRQMKAKFMCTSITDNGYNKSANLQAIYGKEGENLDFAKATPSGSIQITIDKDVPASEFLKPQSAYYVYFEEVPKD